MTLIDAIAQPRLLLACAGFGLATLLLARVERRFLAAMAEHTVTGWLAEHVYLPLARVFSILIFIALAYPALFGLREAPDLHLLLAGEERRFSQLVNLAFLLSLLLPLLPVAGRLPALVLPAQGLLAAAMLFDWLAQARGVQAQLWPGWTTAGLVVLWLILGQRLAVAIAQWLGDLRSTPAADDAAERVYLETAILFFQMPAILLYTLGLGEQLH
ncbi:MAG: hypothetical protein ACLGH6_03030 [Gammaproteobacteria bacterium]